MRTIALLLILLASTAQAQTVRYTLAAYASGTNDPLTTVKSGQTFDLAVIVQDLRAEGQYVRPASIYGPAATLDRPRGVFGAYCQCFFDYRLATVLSVQYSPFYPNGKLSRIGLAGLREFGGMANMSQLGTAPVEVIRANMLARGGGTLNFKPTFGGLLSPVCDTVVHAAIDGIESQYVPPAQIEAVGTSLTVERQ